MSAWAVALRIARRELLRAKGRTALVLVMVLVPVAAVVCLSTLLRTSEIDAVEGLPANLGEASARLDVAGGVVEQDPLLRFVNQYDSGPVPTETDLLAVLPSGSRLLPVKDFQPSVAVQVGDRLSRVQVVGVDLGDSALRGPYRVLDGRAPTGPDEVAVSQELADDGIAIGSAVELPAGRRTVTGVVAQPRDYGATRAVVGTDEAVGVGADTNVNRWYVTGPGVPWDDVRRLNALGVTVLSEQVVLDPPPASEVPDPGFSSGQEVTIATIGLIAVMAVLEVALLAGPAFAVGARRQRRSLALLAAGGGQPSHVRRVVLAQGLLVGVAAAAVGAPVGIAVAALARAPLSRWAGAQWGPFDVGWLDVALVVLVGAATALLAALAPAWVMARQPVVAALQGRRVTTTGAGRPALLGLVLLGVGLAVTLGALREDGRYSYDGYAELGVAAGAIPTVLGAVLLAPAALSTAGRLAARLPLALRFAVRDADRQRGRTAPAVAAIAATVAGVIALGTASSSDATQNRDSYRPSGPAGVAVVTGDQDTDWAAVQRAARAALPGEDVDVVRGLPAMGPPGPGGFVETQVCRVGERADQGRCYDLYAEHGANLGSDLLVGVEALEGLAPLLQGASVPAARRVLADGGVLVASPVLEQGTRVELRRTRFTIQPGGTERAEVLATVTASAGRLPVSDGYAPARVVLSEPVAAALGEPVTVGLLLGDDLGRDDQDALEDALLAVDDAVLVQVERGYDRRGDRPVVLVLSLVAGGLVLAGTLAATALALSEARPDLATLGQVGARPRTRRAVAGGYALVLGLVGAVLGVLAGLIPGIAVSVPLTRGYATGGFSYGPLTDVPPDRDFVVDVPWLLVALVLVVLPLVSAAVAAAATRSRLDGPTRRIA